MRKDGIILCLDHCKTHMQAVVSWNENKASGTSTANRLDAASSQLISRNWHYLKTILQILLVCSQQEIALRGHESLKSSNRGNFLEILKLMASHDEIVKDRLTCRPRNAVYTSSIIQNELLHIMGEKGHSIICSKIQESCLFSIWLMKARISLRRNS